MPQTPDTDVVLCRRAAGGDRGAFRVLVQTYEKRLRSFLSHVAGGDLADEIAQDAFLKAWQALHSYRGEAPFFSWLSAIGWRCFVDHARREGSESRKRTAAGAVDRPRCHEQDDVLDLARALSQLQPVERAALVLCDGHGWSHGQAARILKMPLGTLKGTVRRAKQKCREFLEARDYE